MKFTAMPDELTALENHLQQLRRAQPGSSQRDRVLQSVRMANVSVSAARTAAPPNNPWLAAAAIALVSINLSVCFASQPDTAARCSNAAQLVVADRQALGSLELPSEGATR
jgi:hypothetical protein